MDTSSDDLGRYLRGHECGLLALDLVSGLKEPEQILRDFGLEELELVRLLQNPIFAERVRETSAAWLASGNTAKRIEAKAQLQLEDAQLTLTTIANDGKIAPEARLKAIAQMAELAGIRKGGVVTGNDPGSQQRFQIQIVFAGAQQALTIDGIQDEEIAA